MRNFGVFLKNGSWLYIRSSKSFGIAIYSGLCLIAIVMTKSDCDYIQGYFYSYVYPISEGLTFYENSRKQPVAD